MSLSDNFNHKPSLSQAFQAVLTNPDDDGARRKYASLLPDSEKDRQEYIRTALVMAEMEPDDYEYGRFATRMYGLELRHKNDWRPAWDPSVDGDIQDYDFHRGFVEHVTIDANIFSQKAALVLAPAPVRHLDLVRLDNKPFPRSLFSNLALKGIRSLTIRGELNDDDIKALAASPYLKELRWLDLSDTGIGYAAVETLVKSRGANMPNLEYVDLSGNPCDPADAVYYDQGVAIEHETSHDRKRLESIYGSPPWLNRQDDPSRFNIAGNGHKGRSSAPNLNKGP